jgi:RND family efflux transporter MFP subunit
MTRNQILPGVALLAAIAALLAALFWPESSGAEEGHGRSGDFRFPVTYAEIVLGDAAETVELVGDVVSARRSTLAFHRTGTLANVHARLGDRVEKGQLLAELDDAILAEQHAAAVAALEVTRVQAEFAEREADRAEKVGGGVVAESEADRLRSEADTAEARVQQQEAETRRLAAELDHGRLTAPFAGIIARRLLDEGAQTGPTTPVLDLVDLNRREIRLEVPAPLVGALEVGSLVDLNLDERPEFHLQRQLDALIPATERGSRSFLAVVRLDDVLNQDGTDLTSVLLPGLFVRASLTLKEMHDQMLVPVDAILRGERGKMVVVADPPAADAAEGAPTVARFVPVRILVRGADQLAIQALVPGGLKVGDKILVTGVQNVFPGAPLGLSLHSTEQ